MDGSDRGPARVTKGLLFDLAVPPNASALVVLVRGGGGSGCTGEIARRALARSMAVLSLSLLAPSEAAADAQGALRFDIGRLGRRLRGAIARARLHPRLTSAPVCVCASGTGAAAAMVAAAELSCVQAVVSYAGRPDLAGPVLGEVRAHTLLIVDGGDLHAVRANCEALRGMTGVRARTELLVVPRASDDRRGRSGRIAVIADAANAWFTVSLVPA